MGERAELENDRVSLRTDDLAVLVDRIASFLRTRPPVDEEGIGVCFFQIRLDGNAALVRKACSYATFAYPQSVGSPYFPSRNWVDASYEVDESLILLRALLFRFRTLNIHS